MFEKKLFRDINEIRLEKYWELMNVGNRNMRILYTKPYFVVCLNNSNKN